MSFGEGDLHAKVAQLTTENSRLMDVNGRLCAEINRQEGRIRELESLLRDMHLTWKRLDLEGVWPTSGHNGWKTFTGRLERLGLLEGGDA